MANENMNAPAQDPKPAVVTPTVAPIVAEPKHAPDAAKAAPAPAGQSEPVRK